MSTSSKEAWDKFLNPESLKQTLLSGGIYLAAFEMLKDSVVGRPRAFYCHGFENGQEIISPEYKTKVLDLAKHPYQASALWWKNYGVLTDADIALAWEIREHRNEIGLLPKT